jgi:thermitase
MHHEISHKGRMETLTLLNNKGIVMKKLVAALALLPTLGFASDFHPNRLIVKMKPGMKVPSLKYVEKTKNLFGNVYVVHTSKLEQTYEQLQSNPALEYVQKDFKNKQKELATKVADPGMDMFAIRSSFNDPKVGKQWTFKSASRNGISVTDAYKSRRTQPRETIIVAVVDTGVDYKHEDLKDVMWTNPGEIAGNGIDDDGNGYIDDIHGINTLVRDSQGNATVDMMDKHNHGTHVAGSIGATQNNNKGIAGIASNVQIMGIRTVPNAGDELDVDVVEAFIYAAKNGAKIINCSFGKSRNEGGMAVSDAIDFIGKEYGTLVVAAAGNSTQNIDKTLTYPASFQNDNLLVVASTGSWGNMSYFSNYGKKNVDVAAPGSSVYSTVRGGYSSMSGTSMASPNTAGLAAEVLSHFPDLTPVELKKVIMDSVTVKSGWSNKIQSSGRIDLKKALNHASSL